MSAPDASHDANVLASSTVARTAEAAQGANIAARLERLPLTSYQKGIFAIIATAWLFDSMDLGALTFLLGSIKQTFQLSTAEAGLLSSMSFFGMFLGAASAGVMADEFGRSRVFQVSMIFWGLGSLFCGLSTTATMLGASRLLLGFGMGMEFPVAQSIVSEILPAAKRGRYIAFLEGFLFGKPPGHALRNTPHRHLRSLRRQGNRQSEGLDFRRFVRVGTRANGENRYLSDSGELEQRPPTQRRIALEPYRVAARLPARREPSAVPHPQETIPEQESASGTCLTGQRSRSLSLD
jgi:hypothetical protein